MPDGTGATQPQGARNDPDLRRTLKVIPSVIKRDIQSRSRTTPFLIWVSFLVSFSVSRLWVILFQSVGGGQGKEDVAFQIGRNIIIAGYHVHHIAIGFILLAIAGWAALHWRGKQVARASALMYGIGLGFVVDELGFIIGNIRPYRGDVEVFYIAVFLGALLMSAVYFPSFWRSVRRDVRGVARLIATLPSLQEPRQKVPRAQIDREVEAVLGPARPNALGHAAGPPPEAPPAPPAPAIGEPHRLGTEPLDKQALFGRLLGRIVDVMILIIFFALLLGLAKLVLSLTTVFIGLSVSAMMQPILVGTLTLLVGVELFRAMLEYVRSSRIMLPFLVDAGILLGLRELANELYRSAPDAILVAVIAATLVALGGLRVFLVRTMLPPQGPPGSRMPAER